MRKIVSLVLALMVLMSLALAVPAGAVGTSGGTGSVPVALTADASTFSVAIPTSIPLSIDGNANVTCPSNLSVTNDSAGPVKVTGISVKDGTWTLANYNGGDRSLLASEKVNSSKLGLALWPDGGTKSVTSTNGTQNLTIDANQWVIAGNGKSLRFACDAIASAVSSAITTAVHAVDVVFTIGWSVSQKDVGENGGVSDAPYLTFASPSAFSMSVRSPGWNGTIEYSTNAVDWAKWNGSSIAASTGGGEYTLYFRGSNNTQITGGTNSARIWTINGTNVQCRGNIETLLDYVTVEDGEHPDMGRYCYANMFRDCKSLTTAPELPATTLADSCYDSMLRGCTGLTTAPELPATTLANSCYYGMFERCTSLTTAPELPATTLAYRCYSSMFDRCTSLTTTPELPATNLADSCYQYMFNGCTSLTIVPALPATTLVNSCYQRMFCNCTSLTTAPELPATTLANSCYENMFNGCTSLTTAPELPATTLADSCYRYMFSDCTSLKISATHTGDYTKAYRIPTSGDGTMATDALYGMFSYTGGTFTETPEINTTYYLHSSNRIVGK